MATNSRQVRKVYLITLRQAPPDVSRKSFVDAVVRAFEVASTARVVQWACSQEFHAIGGHHFHMSVKLDKIQRWLRIRNYLAQHDGLPVNFSGLHHDYYSAWKYVTKKHVACLQSPGHPDLNSLIAPTTNAASAPAPAPAPAPQAVVQISQEPSVSEAVANEGESSSSGGRRKRSPKPTLFDVSQLVVRNNLKTRLELVAYADRQRSEGNTDLLRFIVNRGKRVTERALQAGWEIAHSQERLHRSTKPEEK